MSTEKNISTTSETIEPIVKKPIAWKTIIRNTLWILVMLSVATLFVAASQIRKQQLCKEIKVTIQHGSTEMFIHEQDIESLINATGLINSKAEDKIDLRALENAVKQNAWVKNADLYFDNNMNLYANIEQRIPISRLFCLDGNSFYLDSKGIRLPLVDGVHERVPVFTSFPTSQPVLSNTDSSLLTQVTALSNFIHADTFWNAQIAQIDINSDGTFEMVPTIGNQIILFGDTADMKIKFKKWLALYLQLGLAQVVNQYEKIDLRFNGQVIATHIGMSTIKSDSLLSKDSASTLPASSDTLATQTFNQKNILNNQNKQHNYTLSSIEDGISFSAVSILTAFLRINNWEIYSGKSTVYYGCEGFSPKMITKQIL